MSDVANESPLLSDRTEGILHLTLNRPEKRNALSAELVSSLHGALDGVEADDSIRVVVLRGAGRDFCSGADLAELEAVATKGYDESLEDALRLGDVFAKIRSARVPVVAAVRGRALAGGAGLAAACDVVLAEDDAAFGFPEIHLGFVPAMVMTILRRKVTEGRAFDLVSRGHRISAAEAHRIGLVTAVHPVDRFENEVDAYVRELAQRPPGAMARTKRLLYELDGLSFDEGLRRGAEVNAEARQSDECREGVRRFLEKR